MGVASEPRGSASRLVPRDLLAERGYGERRPVSPLVGSPRRGIEASSGDNQGGPSWPFGLVPRSVLLVGWPVRAGQAGPPHSASCSGAQGASQPPAMTKREVVIFFAGVEAFHTLSHLVLSVSGQLPMRVFGFNDTAGLNVWAIVVNAAVTVALFWWASKVRRVRP